MVASLRFPDWTKPIAVGLAYWITAALSLWLTKHTGISSMWPPSGIILAALIRWPGATGRQCLAAAAVASMLANMLAGTSLIEALGYTLANIAQAITATLIWRRLAGNRAAIRDWSDILRLCTAVIASAPIGSIMACFTQDRLNILFAITWLDTVILGMLIMTPVLLISRSPLTETEATSRRARLLNALATLGLLSAVTAGTFWQTRYPLLFVPPAALLIVTWRLRLPGASAGVLIVAVIGSILTATGRGPIALMHTSLMAESFMLQVYLLTLFATVLPLASLLASHDSLALETIQTAAALRRANDMLADAETVAGLGHWQFDRHTARLHWSTGAAHIHGRTESPERLPELLSFYHPGDRTRIRSTLAKALVEGLPFKLEARIVMPDDAMQHVAIIGRPIVSAGGQISGLFGTVQDITERVVIASQLEKAKTAAETAAAEAIKLADVDALTGVASRRRILADLEEAFGAAHDGARGLTIILFDIDHFKNVNDRHGHDTGDTVLSAVAQAVAAALRPGDRIGRLGGEEFLILSPARQSREAFAHADRLREIVSAVAQEHPNLPLVTASFGVATFAEGTSSTALLRAADEALYAAKAAGRDRVRLAA